MAFREEAIASTSSEISDEEMVQSCESNPCTKSFIKRKGFANMTGEYYEVKLVTLLFLRALQSKQKFHIASNMQAAGNFDDIVLSLGHHNIFLQLKHKENSKSVLRMLQLVNNKDFKLLKYLKSYLNIECQWMKNEDLQRFGRFENSVFVVYTNAGIDDRLINNVGNSELLSLVNTGGKCVKLADFFQDLPKYKENWKDAPEEVLFSKINETKIREFLSELCQVLGDSSGYQQFLSHFYFCVKEAAEEQLDDYIREELCAVCGTDVLFAKLITAIQKWWKNSNCYLTEHARFWQDILQESIANVVKKCPKLNVKFDEMYLNTIREFVSLESRILFLKTPCIDLTRLKVLQSLESNFVVDGCILTTRLSEVLALWKLGACGELLLLELNSMDGEIALELANVLKSCPETKLIIISEESKSFIVELFRPVNVFLFIDTPRLKQFDSVSQIKLLETKIIFQGVSVKLISLAEESFIVSAITEQLLMKLLTADIPLEVGDEMNNLDYYYISRTFVRSEYVDEGIFKSRNVCFAVTGVSRRELKRLLPSDMEVVEIDQKNISKDDKCRHFIIIRNLDDFLHLCKSHENIHWIHKSSKGFVWKQSKGNMTPVENHLLGDKTVYSSIEEILKLPEQIVVIVAKPGMGKSTELSHICCVLKENDPSIWIVRVDLSKYIPYLKLKQISAVELLEKVGKFETQFERDLFEHQVNVEGNVAVFFDGFDEISPRYSKKVIELVKELLNTKVKKIFVTTRPIKRKELEHEFCVLSFSLLPFTRSDQNNFLLKFWNVPCDCTYDVTQFILTLLERSKKSVIDVFSIGIPLETLLLANVFHNDALHYCRTGVNKLPQNLNIVELYKRFIDNKFEIYYERLGVDVSNPLQVDKLKMLRNCMEQKLIACALLVTLMDNDIDNIQNKESVLKKNMKFVERFCTGEETMGIVTDIVNNKAMFIHQTFAEYFAGLWLSRCIVSRWSFSIDIYKNENYQTIRSFCDRFLARDCELHLAVLEKDLSGIRMLFCENNIDVNSVDLGGRTALHLCAMYFDEFGDHRDKELKVNIARILLEYGADIDIEDKILCQNPLQMAEDVQGFALIELFLEKNMDKKDLTFFKHLCRRLSLRDLVTVLRNRGFKHTLIDLLLRNRKFEILKGIMKHLIENGYINLVVYFLEHRVNPYQRFDDGYSLLGCAVRVQNVEIAKLLVKDGANVNTTYKDGETPLLLAIKNEQSEMVQFLLQSGAKIEKRDNYRQTPLMRAVKRNSLDIANLLIKHGACVNARNYFGGTALTIATRHGQKNMVQLLLENGADIEAKSGYYEDTPLLIAIKKANVQVVELLVKGRKDSFERTEDGEAPFLYMVENEQRKINRSFEMEDKILSPAPLLRAITEESLTLSEQLIRHGANVDAEDRFGDTALTIAMRNGQKAIVQLLLKNGADFEKKKWTS